MTEKKTTSIVGQRECPTGFLREHDGDERRANLCSDDRVLCVICGSIAHDIPSQLRAPVLRLPMSMRELIAALISSIKVDMPTFQLSAVNDGRTETISTERAAAAVAQGFDGSVFDNVRIALRVPPYAYETIEISYSNEDFKTAEAAPAPAQVDLTALSDARPPQSVMKAAGELVTNGFDLIHVDTSGATLRTATFCKGEGGSRRHGISAVVRWIVL